MWTVPACKNIRLEEAETRASPVRWTKGTAAGRTRRRTGRHGGHDDMAGTTRRRAPAGTGRRDGRARRDIGHDIDKTERDTEGTTTRRARRHGGHEETAGTTRRRVGRR